MRPLCFFACAYCLALTACGPAVDPATIPPAILGPQVYREHCLKCHGATGSGLALLYPPLANSPVVQGDPETLTLILLHGLEGPLEVNGQLFNNQMPEWKFLHDAQIAAVASFIRGKQDWGNRAEPITMDQVAQIRAKHKERVKAWTWKQLEAVREAAP